jgi:hypothetical protein
LFSSRGRSQRAALLSSSSLRENLRSTTLRPVKYLKVGTQEKITDASLAQFKQLEVESNGKIRGQPCSAIVP